MWSDFQSAEAASVGEIPSGASPSAWRCWLTSVTTCDANDALGVPHATSGVQLPTAGQDFLRPVIENGRLAALPEIAHQFRELRNTQSGASDAVVYSAFPISAQQLAEVQQALEKRFGRKLNVTVQEDASLIGGIRVAIGDEVLDTSVKARLEQMKAALTA